jgi:putative ABC transport system permease protein
VLRQDVRLGVRLLTRNPGFAATTILTLALGIAGSTSIFSVVYAVVLRPLAFPESERVVAVGWAGEGEETAIALSPGSYGVLQALREQCTTCEAIGGIRSDSLTSEKGALLVLRNSPDIVGVGQSFAPSLMASASIFKIFGASTVLGRLPDEQDEQPGATPVAVLGYSTWTSVYGRDPGVVGRTLVRDLGAGRQTAVTIVGVLAPGVFAFRSHEDVPAWSSLDPDVMRARDGSGREFLNTSGTLPRLSEARSPGRPRYSPILIRTSASPSRPLPE